MKLLLKLLFIAILIPLAAIGAENREAGTATLYLLEQGKPVAGAEVIFDGSRTMVTDRDGWTRIRLVPGKHQVQITVKGTGGRNGIYMKKPFEVKAGRDTKLIALVRSDDNATVTVREPLSAAAKEAQKSGVKGVLLGKVVISGSGRPIAGAHIFVKGTSIDTRTGADGSFRVEVPADTNLSLSVVHSAYSASTINNIVVKPKSKYFKKIELTPASMELEEYVVLAPKIEGSITAVIDEQKNSDTVGDVLGSEQFSKSGDSSVASALKRVSGITIVGGKYVYVRGLGDRFSTVMFNGLHLPSPEPTKRVVPLDIFPTSIIKSMTIQKSFDGEIPATFGGGTVLIESKDIPKEGGFAKLSLELIGNDSTGKKVSYNPDNSIALPAAAIRGSDNFNYVNNDRLTQEMLQYRTLDRKETTLPPGGKIGLSFGDSSEINDKLSLGVSVSYFYKQTADSVDDLEYHKYVYDINSRELFHDSDTKAQVTSFRTQQGGMFNIGADYYGDNSLKYSYFAIEDNSDKSIFSSIDYLGDTEDREKSYLEYVTKKVATHQIIGHNHLLFKGIRWDYLDDLKIDWGLEHAEADRDEPGTVEYNYLHQTSGLNWDQKSWYYYFILKDIVDNYRVDLTLPYQFHDQKNYTKLGLFHYKKSRDFDSRRFKLSDRDASQTTIKLSDDIDAIYQQGSAGKGDLQFESAYIDSDSYKAEQELNALYLKQLYSITHNVDLTVGVRFEDSTQQLFDAKTGKPFDPLETSDIFPGLGVTWRFLEDKMQLRAAVARTISRPDFREFSINRYKDPITENIVFGNPDLKATYINHADLKYEWYLSADELFSLALFMKNFENPIETVVRKNDAQGNEMEQSYANAKKADSYGIEVDLRKRFGFINETYGSRYLFAMNYAWIQSNIQIDPDAYPYFTKRLTTHDRAMQGQSPYVVNLQFGYDNPDTGDSAMLLYNQIGERIVSLGTDGNEDIYEQPFQKLDFTTKWRLYKSRRFTYSLLFKAQNLLDDSVDLKQGEKLTQTFKPGRSYALKFSMKY
ncbi:MAG TPA: hypothetical protein ENK93_00925 [Campylobacteraceae bacterium]|nr:hypothetical protein [Campylobacteraceae bacterium]